MAGVERHVLRRVFDLGRNLGLNLAPRGKTDLYKQKKSKNTQTMLTVMLNYEKISAHSLSMKISRKPFIFQ
jgi:hypothetical protein